MAIFERSPPFPSHHFGYPVVSFQGCKFRLTEEHVEYENPNVPHWNGMENGAICFKDIFGGRRCGTVPQSVYGFSLLKKTDSCLGFKDEKKISKRYQVWHVWFIESALVFWCPNAPCVFSFQLLYFISVLFDFHDSFGLRPTPQKVCPPWNNTEFRHSTGDLWKNSPFRTSTDQACILFIAVIKSCAQNVGTATFQVDTGGPWEIKGFFGNGGISLVKGERFEAFGHNFG